jgi:hypothetical protein
MIGLAGRSLWTLVAMRAQPAVSADSVSEEWDPVRSSLQGKALCRLVLKDIASMLSSIDWFSDKPIDWSIEQNLAVSLARACSHFPFPGVPGSLMCVCPTTGLSVFTPEIIQNMRCYYQIIQHELRLSKMLMCSYFRNTCRACRQFLQTVSIVFSKWLGYTARQDPPSADRIWTDSRRY